jgi:ankyrin repeat protein
LPDWQRRTPLHEFCAETRDAEEADALGRMFLEHGAAIDAIDEEDRSTPLGMAARTGRARLVELLLDNGADPNGGGADWARPLAWAQRRGHGEVADMLRRRGAR